MRTTSKADPQTRMTLAETLTCVGVLSLLASAAVPRLLTGVQAEVHHQTLQQQGVQLSNVERSLPGASAAGRTTQQAARVPSLGR